MITFTVAHRLSTIEDADTILVFKSGKISAKAHTLHYLNHVQAIKNWQKAYKA